DLGRPIDGVLLEGEVTAALALLNPAVAAKPERVDEILPKLRACLLQVHNDGLVAANQEMTEWLRGQKTVRYIGTETFDPVRLIDFDDVGSNSLVVSTEVTFALGHEERRYDLVLWVNGFPLVVGETKTPISHSTSWLNGAIDIHDAYEVKTA